MAYSTLPELCNFYERFGDALIDVRANNANGIHNDNLFINVSVNYEWRNGMPVAIIKAIAA